MSLLVKVAMSGGADSSLPNSPESFVEKIITRSQHGQVKTTNPWKWRWVECWPSCNRPGSGRVAPTRFRGDVFRVESDSPHPREPPKTIPWHRIPKQFFFCCRNLALHMIRCGIEIATKPRPAEVWLGWEEARSTWFFSCCLWPDEYARNPLLPGKKGHVFGARKDRPTCAVCDAVGTHGRSHRRAVGEDSRALNHLQWPLSTTARILDETLLPLSKISN
mmetsp:Transcript_432/g.904  ORF Transcript_432/g.904 Transcript_432/m.904 type:complete len:220 (-) Transcript_432:92-751(-)